MRSKNRQHGGPRECPVRLAIDAVESSGHPLDLDAGDDDTAPVSLSLPAAQETTACERHRFVCAVCGTPLRRNPE